MDKLMQLIGIVLLYLVGLGGSEYILSKERALTALKIRQQGELCKEEESLILF